MLCTGYQIGMFFSHETNCCCRDLYNIYKKMTGLQESKKAQIQVDYSPFYTRSKYARTQLSLSNTAKHINRQSTHAKFGLKEITQAGSQSSLVLLDRAMECRQFRSDPEWRQRGISISGYPRSDVLCWALVHNTEQLPSPIRRLLHTCVIVIFATTLAPCLDWLM